MEKVTQFSAFFLPNRESPWVPVHVAECWKQRLPAGQSALLRDKNT